MGIVTFGVLQYSILTTPLTHYSTPSVVLPSEMIERTWREELAQDSVLQRLADCESSSNPKAINHMDSDGLKAYGLFQYKTFTWEAFQKEMGVSGLDIFSGADQLRVTKWAMKNGKASHWGICL